MITFKPHNFRIDSTGWEKTIYNNKEYLVNPTNDIWEITDGDCKGEQLFTWEAAMRETQKAGERIPTDEEFSEILKIKEDMPNIVFSGCRNTSGTYGNRGTYAYFWSSTQSSANAWARNLDSSYSTVYRDASAKAYGFSVRCIEEIPQLLKHMTTLKKSNKALLNEQEAYWEENNKINVVLSEKNVHFISSLLREDDKNEDTSEWRENMKKDLRFLLHLNRKKFKTDSMK